MHFLENGIFPAPNKLFFPLKDLVTFKQKIMTFLRKFELFLRSNILKEFHLKN